MGEVRRSSNFGGSIAQLIDFTRRRLLFFVISMILIIPGIISLVLPGGLKPGIDFTSGSILTLHFHQRIEQLALREAFADLGHTEAIVQRSEDIFLVRTFPLAVEERTLGGDVQQQSERQSVERALVDRFGGLDVLGFDSVSPIVAGEIVRNAIFAVLAACLGIALYLWFAFRHVRSPWRYGICAVAALLHDAILLLGAFSLLGRFTNIELDALFVTATLTVIGFSVHDTIVVFDRIREIAQDNPGESFETIVNHGLTQTLGRSIATSVTTLLALFSLLLFGGVTIRPFVLALLIGVISGTYSSIFNASMLLVVWESEEASGLFGRRRSDMQAV